MVSLWGSKDNGEEHEEGDESPPDGEESRRQPQRHSRGQDPDERSRLLPPRNDGFLDPDDPAVSPYNLWSVRALRYLCVLFLTLSFLWWALLLISIFVSPPMMHSRGSGFFDFSYTTLTIGNLLVGLLFFSTPSKAMEIGSLIVTAFLLIDMIIILSVGRLRVEEGWVGIASVIWATLIALYNVLTDRVVAWGKKEEEERLTGRRETRRSLREWCAVLTAAVLMVVMIAVVILLTATLVLRSRDASLDPPGKRYYVDGDKYEIHFACVGNVTYNAIGERNPTVLVEAGEYPLEDRFDDWIYNAYRNGTISRYCYYDRPGFAWSDNAPSPHSAGMTSDALSETLARAGEKSPWVLVSAGVGGIYSRIFASRHPRQIRGIFLVDALHEDLLYRIGSPSRGFILWARGIISPLGWDRLAGALFQGRSREDRVYGATAYQSGKFIKAKLQENLVADSLTKSEVSQARNIQSEKTPVVVISSGIEVGRSDEWQRKQKDLTTLTNKLISWDVVNGAPHEVWRTLEGRTIMEKRLVQTTDLETMSHLQRSFAKAKLAGLPFEPALPPSTFQDGKEEEEEEAGEENDGLGAMAETAQDDDSSSASSASSASSTGTIRPSPSKHLFARPKGAPVGRKPLDPLPWSDFFNQEFYLENVRPTETITHHVYITAPAPKGPLFVTHHGAGSTGLSFALFAAEIRKALPHAGVLSLDARGHGETAIRRDAVPSDEVLDLGLSVLSQDLVDVVLLTQEKIAWSALPDIVFVGHSLGGAVITDVAMGGKLGKAVLGYVVLDVVEGSAIDALQSMQSYLSTRPTSFPSVASAIEWHIRSRTILNSKSARISVPSLLRQDIHASSPSHMPRPWIWHTNLAATQPFWEGWFVGLSHKFLNARGGKLLLLAGTDRLDKELMIGQMQGKYQLQVFPEAGHFIHEDQAEKTAMVLADFYRRNDRSALVLPRKVGATFPKKT